PSRSVTQAGREGLATHRALPFLGANDPNRDRDGARGRHVSDTGEPVSDRAARAIRGRGAGSRARLGCEVGRVRALSDRSSGNRFVADRTRLSIAEAGSWGEDGGLGDDDGVPEEAGRIEPVEPVRVQIRHSRAAGNGEWWD